MQHDSIHVNHLGFRPDDPLKRAVMPDRCAGKGFLGNHLFRIIEVSQFIQHGLDTPENRDAVGTCAGHKADTPLGPYAICDFSFVERDGGYQIQGDNQPSYPFVIRTHAWKRCLRILLEWYRAAACGEEVPGYHNACHLDDCVVEPEASQTDLAGGWHDAGDLRKWTSTMAYVTWCLTTLVEEHGPDVSSAGVDPEQVWHHLRRGAEYLTKTIDPDSGLVWHSIASAGDNTCNRWTDNTPASGDERVAQKDTRLTASRYVVQTQAAAARTLQTADPELSEKVWNAALRVWQALQPALVEENDIDALAACAVELSATEKRDEFFNTFVRATDSMLQRQVEGHCFGQDRLHGFFVNGDEIDANDNFTGRGGRSLYIFAKRAEFLARGVILWPECEHASRWREALELLVDGCLVPMCRLNPYLAMPSSVFAAGSDTPFGRPINGDLCYRLFPPSAEGSNHWLAATGAALAWAARAVQRPEWAAYGQKQLEWILGFNPLEECMMTGLGYRSAAAFSPYIGPIPGAIINGFTGSADDQPRLCTQREMAPMNMEYWSISTAAMLKAIALLENEPLS